MTPVLIVRAAIDLGGNGRRLWNAISAGMIIGFVIDSKLSVASGFGLNVMLNLPLAGIYVVGRLGSGTVVTSA